jgi:FkbM family methyltransferase
LIGDYLGVEYASAFARFAWDGYNDLLYENYNLSVDDCVLVLGGYLGGSTQIWREKYQVSVILVEPVPDYVQSLRQRFENDSRVSILDHAVSDCTEELTIGLSKDTSGVFESTGKLISVKSVDIVEVLSTLDTFPVGLEMNIEGGEYAILTRLTETGLLSKVENLVVQFHNYGIEQELQRAQIRKSLTESHDCVFNYDWVWERWKLKK